MAASILDALAIAAIFGFVLPYFRGNAGAKKVGDDAGGGEGTKEAWRTSGELLRRPNGPVLFLDFDGVLHPGTAGTFARMHLLDGFLSRHKQVDIVLSTSWRETTEFEKLVHLFSEDVRCRIIGRTPVLDGPSARSREIEALVDRFEIQCFCALDDDATLFDEGVDWLVLTYRLEGVTQTDLERVCRVLNLAHS